MTELVEGNRITLLKSGAEYFPALEAACDEAQHEIHIETYIYEDDVAGRRIAAALKRAAQRRVVTHVLLDGYGSKKLNAALVGDLESAGVKILVYRPDITPLVFLRRRLRRMHRKVAVIDARIAFVGGINIIDDMHTPRHTPPRFDYAVRVEGPLLARIHPVVRRLWTLVEFMQFGRNWHNRPLLTAQQAWQGGQRAAFLVRDNLRHRRDIEEAYLAAIAAARSEILVANAYFFPGLSFRRALMDAAARGVRVMLLLQGRVEYTLLHYASRALYGAFLDAGIEIHEYHKSFLHAKVAVIDRRWATVGSSNIDPFSLLLAREANIVVEDRGFATDLRQSLIAAMAAGARQVKRESWKRQPLPRRMATWLAYGVARLLTGVFAYGRGQE
ncbi:MAG: cardiolipin synthase B [Betaproteobacteria bacterium RIFCSPLOWO2_12_FULL_62_13]|nr:MAG: cardiolipin synthase B [Betaproteobacteria bacterium RIFCSPLOWO2_12_FULL_62_13]